MRIRITSFEIGLMTNGITAIQTTGWWFWKREKEVYFRGRGLFWNSYDKVRIKFNPVKNKKVVDQLFTASAEAFAALSQTSNILPGARYEFPNS